MSDRFDQLKPSDRSSGRIKSHPPASPEDQAISARTGADYMRSTRISDDFVEGEGPRPNNRLGSKATSTLRTLVSERDLRILHFVRQHKFATTRQIQRLCFVDHATPEAAIRACTRVLTRLRERRFIYRLERPVGGIRGGSSTTVWGLDVAGDRVTRSLDGVRVRQGEPSSPFIAHTLAISELRVEIEEAALRGDFELAAVQTEPENWRPFILRSGQRTTLKPDLYVETAAGDYEDFWFLEVDLETEWIPALLRKCERYVEHHRTGVEQRTNGVYPLVVWLMTSPQRVAELTRAIADHPRLDEHLFKVELRESFVERSMTPLALPEEQVDPMPAGSVDLDFSTQ